MKPRIAYLRFETLRQANLLRVPVFKNAKGELSHPNGVNDWSMNDWMTALCGEVGELANELKKVHRGDISIEEAREKISNEIADVQCYLDLLAIRCGIHLDEATMTKFNAVSKKIGVNIFIDARGVVTQEDSYANSDL